MGIQLISVSFILLIIFVISECSVVPTSFEQFKINLIQGKQLDENLMIINDEPQLQDISYFLYTNSNRKSPFIILNSLMEEVIESPFNETKKTIFLCHGWTDNFRSQMYQNLIPEILDKYDVNVFAIDWSQMAARNYIFARLHIERLGKLVGYFISKLQNHFHILGDDIIMVGHSLGAHILGCASANLTDKVSTIIGLDPAEPLFNKVYLNEILDESDAKYVQVIHTNGFLLGYFGTLGHADYYPNGGIYQPGCKFINDITGNCSHGRVVKLYIESIKRGTVFQATSCQKYTSYLNGKCKGNHKSPMGMLFVDRNATGKYFLETNPKYPYGQD